MNYTFKGKDYPKELKLHHPEVETILSKDPLDITLREMNHLYDLPLESFTEDENNLILRELGRQQGKTLDELAVDKIVNPFIVRNTLVCLTTSYDFNSFDVVLEILRQTEDIINFNLPDYDGFTYILPMLSLMFEYKPQYLEKFMLEGGITVRGKRIVAEQLSRVASDLNVGNEDHKKKIREQLVSIFGNVMEAYISDYPECRLCDKQLVSHVVKAIVNAGLGELSEQVWTVYENDMIDKAICGDRDVNLSLMKDNTPADMNYVETDPYPLMFLPLHYLWPNDDTENFE
ncbi:hypothetical protein [Hallella absiana]|uniref:hypothetical protein n=1 Tax=Hallella absiana TaxID=2925336 RepID=UPI0021C9E4B2|nr:hypothetical protein [Hallella absiana]